LKRISEDGFALIIDVRFQLFASDGKRVFARFLHSPIFLKSTDLKVINHILP